MLELPPLHPIFLHFPVALLPVAAFFDGMGRLTKRESVSHTGCWSLITAAVMAPLAAASGWLWLREMGEVEHVGMLVHQWLGTAIPILIIPLAVWRYRIHVSRTIPGWPYLGLLLVMLGVVTLQGHLGGLMTFGGGSRADPADSASHAHPVTPTPAVTQPTTTPASTPEAADDWKDSINVKEHRHE